jgi:hypothetical protein
MLRVETRLVPLTRADERAQNAGRRHRPDESHLMTAVGIVVDLGNASLDKPPTNQFYAPD